MRYNGVVATEEDFKRERERRDNQLLDRFKNKLNGRWLATINGFDVDYDSVPMSGQNE
jgi:hypothetical protein